MKRVKKRVRIKKKDFFVITLIMLIIILFLLFKIINNKVKPVMLSYAEEQTKRIATLVINNSINKQITSDFDTDNLFNMTYDNNGVITSIDFNSIIVNKFLTDITKNVEENLKYIELGNIEKINIDESVITYDDLKKGVIYYIPIGYIFNNSLLTNILPKVPVKMNLVGSITSTIDSKITNYGINNAMIQLNINLEVNIRIILPLMSDTTKVTTTIPVAMKLIQGNIPNFYLSGSNIPSVTLPIE